jgi:hypothetical protein
VVCDWLISTMPRLFTFGCSFTSYDWPTWADIIIKDKQQDYSKCENWGKSGASNYYIFNAVIECNIVNQLTKDDTVIIMWTTLERDSYYYEKQWITPGAIQLNEHYSKDYIEKFTDHRGFMIKNYSMMYAIDQILEKIGCTYYFLSMVNLTESDTRFFKKNNQDRDLIKSYDTLLKKIRPSAHEIIFNSDWNNVPKIKTNNYKRLMNSYESVAGTDWPNFEDYLNNNFNNVKHNIVSEIKILEKKFNWDQLKTDFYMKRDHHPFPAEQLKYIDKVLPEIKVSTKTREWAMEIDKKLHEAISLREMDTFNKIWVNTEVKRW